MNKGDARANLQLFPGDRLLVGRNGVVKATVEMNRLAEPVSLMLNQILTDLPEIIRQKIGFIPRP